MILADLISKISMSTKLEIVDVVTDNPIKERDINILINKYGAFPVNFISVKNETLCIDIII